MFAGRKPSTGEPIATSANQIVPPKSVEVQKCCHQTPLSSSSVYGGLGMRLSSTMIVHSNSLTETSCTN